MRRVSLCCCAFSLLALVFVAGCVRPRLRTQQTVVATPAATVLPSLAPLPSSVPTQPEPVPTAVETAAPLPPTAVPTAAQPAAPAESEVLAEELDTTLGDLQALLDSVDTLADLE
ncbi:MAG: hypothetical protein ACUVX9_10270 [Anaerolineae bacterium]